MFETIVGIIIGFLLTLALEVFRWEHKRQLVLKALRAQVAVLPRLNQRNKTATEQSEPEHLPPVLYPIIPFEAAILSEDGIDVTEKTIEATINYLIKANELNSQVRILQDLFFASTKSRTVGSRKYAKVFLHGQVDTIAKEVYMPKIVDELKLQIEDEIKQDMLARAYRLIKAYMT